MSGVNPISFSEIKAWKELTETRVTPREVDILLRLDRTYLKVSND